MNRRPRVTAQVAGLGPRLGDGHARAVGDRVAYAAGPVGGYAERRTLPAAVLDGLANVVAAAQCTAAEESPLWQPFSTFPDGVPLAAFRLKPKSTSELSAPFASLSARISKSCCVRRTHCATK